MPLIICLTTAEEIVRNRTIAIDSAEAQVSSLGVVLGEHTAHVIETITRILRTATDMDDPINDKDMPGPNYPAFGLRQRIDGIKQLAGIAIVDPAGKILRSTFDSMTPAQRDQVNISVASMAASTSSMLVGKPFRDESGRWFVLVIKPITDRLTDVAGYAAGFINLKYFEDFFESVQFTDTGAITLFLSDGTVLARFPPIEAAIGTGAAGHSALGTILVESMAGTLVGTNALDGIDRVQAIRALRIYPLAIGVSVSKSDILKTWRNQAIVMTGLAILASLLIAGLFLLLSARARHRDVFVLALSKARHAALKSGRQMSEQMAQREEAEAALRQTQRIEAVGQLSGGVAHDFNNLLAVVLTNVEMLLEIPKFQGESRAMLLQAQAAAERGAVMTGQLLAFSRQQSLRPAPIDLRVLLPLMTELLHAALGRSIVLNMHFDAQSAVMADAHQVELMVMNLTLNARDAMPDGGTLTIRTEDVIRGAPDKPNQPQAGEYVLMEVADTGAGMTEDVRNRAFDPFFTTKGPGAGSGMGLSQVYGLAVQSGGSADIESEPGRGTTIRIWLPRADPASAVPIPSSRQEVSVASGSATILVVDDDTAVRNATARMLRRSGYTVLEDDSAEPALERLAHDREVSMVVSDIAMPGMNGFDLARAAQDVRPGLPFVFISGYSDPENVAAESGSLRLLRKPFRSADLIAEIEAVLAAKDKPAKSI